MRSALLSRRFAANYFSTLGFIGLSYWIISSLSGFHRGMLQGQVTKYVALTKQIGIKLD